VLLCSDSISDVGFEEYRNRTLNLAGLAKQLRVSIQSPKVDWDAVTRERMLPQTACKMCVRCKVTTAAGRGPGGDSGFQQVIALWTSTCICGSPFVLCNAQELA
jgi:hypothetical protein